MTIQLLAAPIRDSNIQDLRNKALELRKKNIIPKLRIFLVGNDPAGHIYVKSKQKLALQINAECEIKYLPQDCPESDFIQLVEESNNDKDIHGILIQLPLPEQLKHINVFDLVHPDKDVDGFGINSVIGLYRQDRAFLCPCTPQGIMTLLDFYKIPIEGKNVVIIGRSLIVGKPLSMMMMARNATVTVCHSRTKNISHYTKAADIIVSAIGKANFLTEDYIRKDQTQIIIDVGINRNHHQQLCGDVNYEKVAPHVHAITPVPGGVGPMTIFELARNLLKAARNTQ